MIDDEIIMDYFGLSKRIKRKEDYLKIMRREFYQQTMSSFCTTDGMKIYSKGFGVDRNVIDLVDREAVTLEKISLLKFKRKHFLRYLKQLPKEDRQFLTKKYKWCQGGMNERLERECFEEVQEIEEAAGYRFLGALPDVVADVPITSEAFTSHFEDMLHALGV